MKMRPETKHATEPQVREGMGVRNSNCLFVVTNPTTSRRHTGLLAQGGTGGPVGPLRTLEDPRDPLKAQYNALKTLLGPLAE